MHIAAHAGSWGVIFAQREDEGACLLLLKL